MLKIYDNHSGKCPTRVVGWAMVGYHMSSIIRLGYVRSGQPFTKQAVMKCKAKHLKGNKKSKYFPNPMGWGLDNGKRNN